MADKMKIMESSNIPAFIVSTPESPGKSRSYRKYAIIAASVVLTIVIILTAILVGVYLFSEAQKEVLKFSFDRGNNHKEDAISDPVANIVQYHITDDNYKAWVFNDFNRDIQALKIQTASETKCYITPLNRTIAMDPTKIAAMGGKNPLEKNETHQLTYRSAGNPTIDHSFLCKPVKDACQGISTYWLFPTCEKSTEVGKRQKRWDFWIGITFTINF